MQNNVKFLRRSEGFDLTQDELAQALGVHRATVISIENGGKTSDEMVMKIAHFFNRDPRDIFLLDGVVSNLQSESEIA